KTIASPGRGILAMDESNATCGKRLASIGWKTLRPKPPSLPDPSRLQLQGSAVHSGAILFEETLYQSTIDGKKIVDVLVDQGIVPGIKVDKRLDGLDSRSAAYYQQGARFAKWILLKPSMVTPGAESKDRPHRRGVAAYTLSLQKENPSCLPGIIGKNTCLKTLGRRPDECEGMLRRFCY
ncbi:UNVERIFIED_CONTAM: Fructose-bisphosphate aldolase 1, chloroplastic, partial [Sesamum radiatum]